MRRYTLMGTFGLILVALVGISIWWQREEWRRRTIVNPNGSRITYLGATYGRKHAIAEWKLQWGWPPIRRVVHRVETPFDTLYLWFRYEEPCEVIPTISIRPPSGSVSSSATLYLVMKSSERYTPRAVRLRDGRTAKVDDFRSRDVATNLSSHSAIYIRALHFPGLPADGQTAQLEFYKDTFFYGSPTAPRDGDPPLRLTIRLPRSPLLDRITKPESLPAVRQKEGLHVRLTGFRWDYTRSDSRPSRLRPWGNNEFLSAEPQLVLEPHEGDPQDWVITRMGFVPVGAGRPLYTVAHSSAPPFITEVLGNWDAPVYHFAVEFKNKRTNKVVNFDFWVPPPPFEQLRRQWWLAEQSRKAIAAKDYANAIQVWDHTGDTFALEASYWRGYAYAMMGDYANAIREFQKVLPSLTTVHHRRDVRLALVCCLLLAGRRAEATQVARNYIQQVYQYKEYLWGIDEKAALMGWLLPDAMPSDAVIESRLRPWRKRIRGHSNPHLIDAIERIRSLQFTHRGDYGKAIRELKAGQDDFRSPCIDSLRFAWLYQKQGKRSVAQYWLRQARAATSHADHPDLWEGILLGRVLFAKEWGL